MKPGETPPERAPLLGHGSPEEPESGLALFNYGPRVRKDNGWLIAYLMFIVATCAWGVALFFNGSPDFFQQISPEHLHDPNSCPAEPPSMRRRGLLSDPDQPASRNIAALLAHPASAVSCTVAGSVTLGFLFVLGFRHMAHFMIRLALALQVVIPASLGVMTLLAGHGAVSAMLWGYCALLLWVFWLWREQIALVGRLLGVTGHALAGNPGLLGVGLAMPLIWGISLVPTLVLGAVALTNGAVVPNSDRTGMRKGDDGAMQCVDDQGQAVMCCTWQVDRAAQAYLALLGVTFTWTTLLLGQIKLFTVAGTVAQWYFSPPVTISGLSAPAPPRRGRVLLSLRHALGPSFGSLCAASAVLTVISYLRQALDAAEEHMRSENKLVAIVCMVVAAILRILLSIMEFLTRFTTVRMAITGEAFLDAAHGAVDLLRRNALDAFGVWWLPPFILGNSSFVLSVMFGGIVWGSSTLVYHAEPNDVSTVVLGVSAWLMAMIVLSFLNGLLVNILESVFVCFAMDRDMARVTRMEVHAVLKEVPGVGAVFEQPDGGLAYGAPAVSRV